MKKRTIRLFAFLTLSAVLAALLSLSVLAEPVRNDMPSDVEIISEKRGDGTVLRIVGKNENNVINWSSFDIAENEKVEFDGKNYLNLIRDENASQILGKLTGGGNIYLVNPDGVLFGANSDVSVGHLFVSTRQSENVNTDFIDGIDPLAGSASGVMGDITTLGKISADSLFLEGNVIRMDKQHGTVPGQSTGRVDGTGVISFDASGFFDRQGNALIPTIVGYNTGTVPIDPVIGGTPEEAPETGEAALPALGALLSVIAVTGAFLLFSGKKERE